MIMNPIINDFNTWANNEWWDGLSTFGIDCLKNTTDVQIKNDLRVILGYEDEIDDIDRWLM